MLRAVTRQRRRSIAIAACLALCSQLVALLHLWLVPHTRCAEHGETVHDARGHAARVTADEPRELSASPSAPGAALDDGHDHCQLLTERRAAHVERPTGTLPLGAVAGAVAPCLEHVPATTTLYRIAPKVSPPVAALG